MTKERLKREEKHNTYEPNRVHHMLKVAKQHIDNNNYGYAKECIETIIEEITNE